MSSKMIEIKGKQISENTIVEALKKHCGFEEKRKVPLASIGSSHDPTTTPNDRLILRVTKSMTEKIKAGAKIVVLDKDGSVKNTVERFDMKGNILEKIGIDGCYSNIKPIFGEINE